MAGTSSAMPLWSGGQSHGFGFDVSGGWKVYCNFGLDQNVTKGSGTPHRMVSRPYCTNAPVVASDALVDRDPGPFRTTEAASRTGGGGGKGGGGRRRIVLHGLSDAVAAEECYDTNCLRCHQLFDQCRVNSMNMASGNPLGGYGVELSTLYATIMALVTALFAQVIYYAQQYFTMTGISKPSTISFGERDFMIQMIFSLIVFVLFTVFYLYSGLVYNVARNPLETLGFFTLAINQFWGFLYSYSLVTMWACFGFLPPFLNFQFRLLGRVGVRLLPFPTQAFLNGMFEGSPWLPHYVLSYSNFAVFFGTFLSTTMPLSLLVVSLSCFTRYAIDRGYHLLVCTLRLELWTCPMVALCSLVPRPNPRVNSASIRSPSPSTAPSSSFACASCRWAS